MDQNAVGGPLFVEILPKEDEVSNRPSYVDAFIISVGPKECGKLLKRLSDELALGSFLCDLSHLKRVRRTAVVATTDEQSSEDDRKRKRDEDSKTKNNIELEVILCPIDGCRKEGDGYSTTMPDVRGRVQLANYLSSVVNDDSQQLEIRVAKVPAHHAESQNEWKDFNAIWPMSYFPKKTKEFRELERRLSDAELEQMQSGMKEAITDAQQAKQRQQNKPVGVVIVSPDTGKVCARASEEQQRQGGLLPDQCPSNPLSTPIILAIQGVSRLERQVAISAGGMQTKSFQRGQYLCTGYDCYTTVEPTVYETMALVHSRIRRVVCGCPLGDAPLSAEEKQLYLPGLTEYQVHALPGTNHRFRAFVCRKDSDMRQRCLKIINASSTVEG